MLSNDADGVYWMARYLERAENSARIVNANASVLMDLPVRAEEAWHPLLRISGSFADFEERYEEADEQSVTRFLVSDGSHPASILSALEAARRNALAIRDIIPRDGWEHVNQLCLHARATLRPGLSRTRRFEALSSVISVCQTITGCLAGTMLHDQAYEFLRLGRSLERADMTTRLIEVRTANILELTQDETRALFNQVQWRSILRSLSAYASYRRKQQATVRREAVLSFLFQDVDFPRSFAYCLEEIRLALKRLPRHQAALRVCNGERRLIRETRFEDVWGEDLLTFCDQRQVEMGSLHEAVERAYFRAGVGRQRQRA